MKKITGIFMAILMLSGIASLPISVYAANPISLTVSNVTGTAGNIITVSVNISENSGMAAATLLLKYDNTKLKLQSAAKGAVAEGLSSITKEFKVEGNYTTVNDSYLFSPDDGDTSRVHLTDAGTMLNVKFQIISGWSGSSPVTLTVATIINEKYQPLSTSVIDGSVNVTPTSHTITFIANGGTGGTSSSIDAGAALTPPTVTKLGYTFKGWLPEVPSTAPSADTTYTAQWVKTASAVSVTKTEAGMVVRIYGGNANTKYQIWSYQKITSDLFDNIGAQACQWVLSKAYTAGSAGTLQQDGSICFTVPDFVSPSSNYTVAVRIADESNTFVSEFRDSYTPAEVSEVVITKVLVDGDFAKGAIIKNIDSGSPVVFKVISNNVPNTVYTATVEETSTSLTASNTNEFSWNTAGLEAGIYNVQLTASNGTTTDTQNVKLQLYSLDTSIQYGNISDMALTLSESNTIKIDPSFTNGSVWYRISEPGREPIFTSGLLKSGDNINYSFTKPGTYQISCYVNRDYVTQIGNSYDDGIIRTIVVPRISSGGIGGTGGTGGTGGVPTEPIKLTANVGLTDVAKDTAILFTAAAALKGPVQYSFWRYDATGFVLVKDWSTDKTFTWTPARVGEYKIEVRAKGDGAGSYEKSKIVDVSVTDNEEQIAQVSNITINETELNTDAQARVPIAIKAAATGVNGENLLYKFLVTDDAMGTSELQSYSVNQDCIWTPRKPGTYTISVLVKNDVSFGAYDAMNTFEISVK